MHEPSYMLATPPAGSEAKTKKASAHGSSATQKNAQSTTAFLSSLHLNFYIFYVFSVLSIFFIGELGCNAAFSDAASRHFILFLFVMGAIILLHTIPTIRHAIPSRRAVICSPRVRA